VGAPDLQSGERRLSRRRVKARLNPGLWPWVRLLRGCFSRLGGSELQFTLLALSVV
jgi:hypothetical protein